MRFIINIALKTSVIIVLNWISWLLVVMIGYATKEVMSIAPLDAFAFTAMIALTLVAMFCMAASLWVSLGWFVLEVMHKVAPGFVKFNHSSWLILASGPLLVFAAVLSRRRSHTTGNT